MIYQRHWTKTSVYFRYTWCHAHRVCHSHPRLTAKNPSIKTTKKATPMITNRHCFACSFTTTPRHK